MGTMAGEAYRRLRETGGLGDLIATLVDHVHHQILVGKGDQHVGLNLHGGGSSKRQRSIAGQKAANKGATDAAAKARFHERQHADTGEDHHAEAAEQYRAAEAKFKESHGHYKAKRNDDGDDAHMDARELHREGDRLGRGPAKPTKTAKKTAEPEDDQAEEDDESVDASKTGPDPAQPADHQPAPEAPKPDVRNEAKPETKPGQAGPGPTPGPRPRGPKPPPTHDPNDTTGARVRTASHDIEVRGTINGRNITTTISAGQQFHTKDFEGKTQLVCKGLFGRFILADGEEGKLGG